MQQLGATASIACNCDWLGCPVTCRCSVGVQENPTPAADAGTQVGVSIHHHDYDRKVFGRLLSRL